MGVTTDKGLLGEAEVIADLTRRGLGIALPMGHAVPFDIVLIRNQGGLLERVQVKYTTSTGRTVHVRCTSKSAWVAYRYTKNQVDWIATYDSTTDAVYYVHSCHWDGMESLVLRLAPTANGQRLGVRWASEFLSPTCSVCESRRGESNP
ncbi:MAG TPA: group I intron-associated PD-(D/E)XK endonuclease [Acidimicrobiia bacterium]